MSQLSGQEMEIVHSVDGEFNRDLLRVISSVERRERKLEETEYFQELCDYCKKHGYVSSHNDKAYYEIEQLDREEALLLFQLPYLFDQLFSYATQIEPMRLQKKERDLDKIDYYYALANKKQVFEFHCFRSTNALEYFFIDAGSKDDYYGDYFSFDRVKKNTDVKKYLKK